MNIAICIIAYNRLHSLVRLLKSLEQAYYDSSIPLIISIDKSQNSEIEKYAKNYKWSFGEKKIITHPKNLGLRNHVIKCGDLIEDFDALIVLEDDIFVMPSFYYYSKACVERFYNDDNIAGISLYNKPFNYHNNLPFYPLYCSSDTYLMQNAQSWGQVWMKRQWKTFRLWYEKNKSDFSSQPHLPDSICNWPNSSWLKYHTRYCIEKNKYFVYPYKSLSTCFDDIGTHTSKSSRHKQSYLLYGEQKHFNLITSIKYDAFFENEIIYSILNIPKEELCVDFYGEKKNRLNKRYWLTCESKPFKTIQSYGLQLKPYELNVINKIAGSELFLYDTHITLKFSFSSLYNYKFNQYSYLYNKDMTIKGCIKYILKLLFK